MAIDFNCIYSQTMFRARLSQGVRATEVFTPTTHAVKNFVRREKMNEQLVHALTTPGRQLVVFGESGTGKSTLLTKVLSETYSSHIISRCTSETTFDNLLLDAFDQLEHFFIDSRHKSKSKNKRSGVGFKIFSVGRQTSRSVSDNEQRLIPPQLTPQRLGKLLGAAISCWVIEDFHKPDETEKRKLAQTFKMFSDMSTEYRELRIIAIGATDTARQVIDLDTEMLNRVTQLRVELMTDDEIRQIITQGESLLNLDMTLLVEDIVQYSMGVPSVCHQLCLNACQIKGIEKRPRSRYYFQAEDLPEILEKYIDESSDTLRAVFEKALMRERERTYDNCRLLLAAIAAGPIEGSTRNEILAFIRVSEPVYPPSNAARYLSELMSDKRGSVLRQPPNGKYRFVDPLHHVYAQANLIAPNKPLFKDVFNFDSDLLYELLTSSTQFEDAPYEGYAARIANQLPET